MRFRHCSRIPFRRKRRVAAFWTSFFLIVVLFVVALDLRWFQTGKSEEASNLRHLEESGISAFVDDPFIDMPVRHADNKYWIFMHILVIAYMLLGLNTVCDAYFTGALDTMVNRWDIKPDVAGATFMAAGGSAPELFTSLIGATISESDVGFGTIVGSAVFNVLFVIGLCGFAASEPIKLTWWPLARDCACYLCGLSLLACFAKTGRHDEQEIELWEAIVLFIAYLAYCTLMYFNENLEAMLVKTPLLPATGCSSSQPIVPSADKTAKGDIMLKLTAVAPMGDTGGSSEGPEAVEADVPAIMVTPAAPSGPPPPLPPSNGVNAAASPPNTCHAGAPLESSDSDKHHHHHHHIKKSQPHFARHHHVSVHGNGEMVATVSGTLSAMLRKPSTHTSPSEGGAEGDAHSRDSRSKDGESREESHAADDTSTAPSPDEKADAEHSDDNEDAASEIIDMGGDDDSEESEEEDDIEALMIMPDERFGQVVWVLSLPIYAPLYYLTPKPDARCFLATFGISLLWIAGFSLFLVYCVEVLGEVLHIHIIIMGFTLLAAGTSIPDAVSSVAVARAGEGDMAVSSSIGSNIFDILVGLPIPWVVKIGFVEMLGKGKSHAVVAIESPYIVLYVLILVFMVFSVILSIHLNGWVLNKMLGIGMGGLYIIFLVTVLSVEFERPSALKF
mmetsp:Transcript_21308/g.38949  ORF Transcript_21308/g.38949 Transcript_21308/m.38949 type:complete len:674 (-) Transcript_21308:69-2090(-)